ncbi:zinc finger CCCH domain-containing protein 5 isoform X4 [Quercus robur]|uniref:zinc finger CCCH domain-containing protein 5 isoform X4 n=1 Tax=Quercus robur TaxID=38942 RepID=UPI00216241F7|nr:zinc finger CCCH domain-containing protein 5 isoform X4 [Quercus robur]
MAEPIAGKEDEEEEEREMMEEVEEETEGMAERMRRKEKRKAKKKMKRKQMRKEMAEKEREEEEARLNDPEEQRKLRMMEEEEKERMERDRKEFEEREKAWIEAMERKKKKEEEEEEEERRKKALEEDSRRQQQAENENELNEDDDWEYVEGPAEIIWKGNEIIVKKKRVKVPKKDANQQRIDNADRPTSNPLPPQSEAFADYKNAPKLSAEQIIENVTQQVPNFGTEQDKAHCPFHLKTGACRFGQRCSRVHFYPDKSCTLLIRNMYNGPGLAWEQDEGLEVCKRCLHVILHRIMSGMAFVNTWHILIGDLCLVGFFDWEYWSSLLVMAITLRGLRMQATILHTDEEVEGCYEEFYEDVHTEFLKFGEIVNFKVCRNGAFHLRGNVYVQYRSLDSAVLVYNSINGRYFAGKQISCEFVNVTRWKVAICGEYMKSRFKTCSHGTACNFIHCFRNPGGDYEWADFDKPPPRYWVRKMASLFGYSDEVGYQKEVEQENLGQLRHSRKRLTDVDSSSNFHGRYYSRSKSKEIDYLNGGGSSRRNDNKNDIQKSTQRRGRTSNDRKQMEVLDEDMRGENTNFKGSYYRKSRSHDTDSEGEWSDRYKDRYYGSARKSSRHQNRDVNHRTHEVESEGGYSDRSEDRETHNGHARKSSRHSRNAKFVDDCEGQEKFDGNWSDRDGDQETHDAYMTKSSRHRRKVGHPDDHMDSKNRTLDTDGEWSDGERDRDRHHRKRSESSRHLRKVGHSDYHKDSKNRSHDPEGEWSDRDTNRDRHHHKKRKNSRRDHNRGGSKNRADDTNLSSDWLDSDGEKHKSQTRKHTRHRNEVLDYSDHEGEPAKKLKDKFHSRESSIEKSGLERGSMHSHSRWDSINENLESDGSRESNSSDQYVQRHKSHDLESSYNSDKYIDKQDRWEPD